MLVVMLILHIRRRYQWNKMANKASKTFIRMIFPSQIAEHNMRILKEYNEWMMWQ